MKPLVNVIANWAAIVCGAAITFVLSPFVVHHLGDAQFGVWGLIVAVVGYLGLLDLGVRVAVTRFVARHEAAGDRDALRRVTSTALALFMVGALLAGVLGVVLAEVLPRLMQLPARHVADARIAFALGGVTVGAALIGGVYGGTIAGLQRFAILNAIDLGTELLRAAAVFVVLGAGGGLVHLAIIQLAAVALRGLAYRVAVWRLQPGLHQARRYVDRGTLREIFRFSAYTVVLQISAVFIYSSDAVIIASIMPVAFVTYFVIAGNLSQAAFQLLAGVSQALYPLVSARQAVQGTLATASLLTRATRLGGLAVLPVIVTLLVRGPTFIGLWMGAPYAELSGTILRVLALGLCLFPSWQMMTSTMIGLNLHRGLVPAYLGEAAGNIVLSIALGLAFGVVGVAWGTTIPRLAIVLVVAPLIARRALRVSVREFAVNAWLRPLASMIPFAVASAIVDLVWPAPNVLVFFLQVALVLPLALVGAWVVGLDRAERVMLAAPVNRLLGRVPAAGAIPSR